MHSFSQSLIPGPQDNPPEPEEIFEEPQRGHVSMENEQIVGKEMDDPSRGQSEVEGEEELLLDPMKETPRGKSRRKREQTVS